MESLLTEEPELMSRSRNFLPGDTWWPLLELPLLLELFFLLGNIRWMSMKKLRQRLAESEMTACQVHWTSSNCLRLSWWVDSSGMMLARLAASARLAIRLWPLALGWPASKDEVVDDVPELAELVMEVRVDLVDSLRSLDVVRAATAAIRVSKPAIWWRVPELLQLLEPWSKLTLRLVRVAPRLLCLKIVRDF